MSFGGQNTSSGLAFKKFETQEEADERKRIRQEQWEKVRKADDPLERPEDDNRSLYEKLQEQKDRKQQEYEEQFKFSNAVKGLDDDEAAFLDEVSERQIQIEKERLSEETSIFKEMRNASMSKIPEKATSSKDPEKTSAKPAPSSSSRKSQQSLLLGAVKRKSSDTQADSKKLKTEGTESESPIQKESESSPGKASESSPGKASEASPEKESSVQNQAVSSSMNGVARVIGILPGIGNYSDDSSDSNSSNSSSEWDDLLTSTKVKRVVITNQE